MKFTYSFFEIFHFTSIAFITILTLTPINAVLIEQRIYKKLKELEDLDNLKTFTIIFIVMIIGFLYKRFRQRLEMRLELQNDGNYIISEDCRICLDRMKRGKEKRNLVSYDILRTGILERKDNLLGILKCGHIFHAKCLDEMVDSKPKGEIQNFLSYPLCRYIDIFKSYI